MIDICLVSWRRREYTVKVIDYLLSRTSIPFRLIWVLNEFRPKEDEEMIRNLPPYIKHIAREHKWVTFANFFNEGLEKARNQAFNFVKSDIFIDTDNDILCPKLDPCWLTQLLRLMEEHPDYAAIALRTHIYVADGNFFHGKTEPVVERNHVGGSLRAMRSEAVFETGGWAERPGRGSEETDICGKLRKLGWKVGYSRELICYHMFGENWGYGDMPAPDHGHSERLAPHIHKYDRDLNPETFQPRG